MAAKAGIIAMTMGAAQLLSKYGITCNVIMPRARTPMTDMGQTAAMFAALGDMHAKLSEYFNDDHIPVWGGYSVPPG